MDRRSALGRLGVIAADPTRLAVDGEPLSPRAGRPPRVGLALGSGALHGVAHIGVLRALERHGLEVDVVAGTSAGAVAGALFAAGIDAASIEAIARRIDWHPPSFSLLSPWRTFQSNDALQALIDRALGQRPIESLPRRFGVVATDFVNGARVLIDRGPSGPAVGASSAIPVAYRPVRIGGRDLVDGALVEPVPAHAARELGADFVIAVDVAYRPDEEAADGLFGAAFQTLHIMTNALIEQQESAADHVLRMNLHHLMMGRSDWFDRLLRAGELGFDRAWAGISNKLDDRRSKLRP